jgi:error-prone DNA polymerase
VADVARRARVSPSVLACLARADAFAGLGVPRRQALWELLAPRDDRPMFANLVDVVDEAEAPVLPSMPLAAQVHSDYHSVGLSLKGHPLGFVRHELDRLKVVTSSRLAELPDKARVRVAGLVLVRQQPGTAKGTVFVTLEDETGVVNLIVWPDVWKRHHRAANQASTMLATGRLQHAEGVTHVVATRLEDLTSILPAIRPHSRDFH